MSTLEIRDLQVSVRLPEGNLKPILAGVTLTVRAGAGLFLAMQYPVEVPGVSVANFLRTAKTAIDGEAPKLRTWAGELRDAMERLHMDPAMAQRNINEGFSGGEKKRHEIMQLELLKPKV